MLLFDALSYGFNNDRCLPAYKMSLTAEEGHPGRFEAFSPRRNDLGISITSRSCILRIELFKYIRHLLNSNRTSCVYVAYDKLSVCYVFQPICFVRKKY